MPITVNIAGQVGQIKLSPAKALWPLFETVINSIQSLEDSNVAEKTILIDALRPEYVQLKIDRHGNKTEEPDHFEAFVVTDNGNGFNTENYTSFLEAYSQLKVKKGCKGIGRFLWLKAFDKVAISSTYFQDGHWHLRSFNFALSGITPEQNDMVVETENAEQQTIVRLEGYRSPYRESVAYSLESLTKKLIEHCLPYFITGKCPQIILKDNRGECFNLNNYYENTYKDSLHQDPTELKGKCYTLYHMLLTDSAEKHELHLCANNREVKSYALSTYIPNMNKKLTNAPKCAIALYTVTVSEKDSSIEYSLLTVKTAGGEILSDEQCRSLLALPICGFTEVGRRAAAWLKGSTGRGKPHELDALIDKQTKREELISAVIKNAALPKCENCRDPFFRFIRHNSYSRPRFSHS